VADQDTEEIVRQRAGSTTTDDSPNGDGPVVAAPQAEHDRPVEVVASAVSPGRRIQFHATWISIAIWAVLLGLLVAFFAFGSVTIYAKSGFVRKMRVDHIWGLFRDDLPQVYHKLLLSGFFYGAIALVVIGMAWMLFLALGTRTTDAPGERAPDRSADTVSPQF
jgi:hypothetical protein